MTRTKVISFVRSFFYYTLCIYVYMFDMHFLALGESLAVNIILLLCWPGLGFVACKSIMEKCSIRDSELIPDKIIASHYIIKIIV